MYTLRKLKPDRSYGMILLPFAALAGAVAIAAVFGAPAGLTFIGVIYTLYASYSFLTFGRTGNGGFVVVALFQLFAGLAGFTWAVTLGQRPNRPGLFFISLMLFFLAWTILLAVTKRIKWRGREVLELAAAPVEHTQNGYTGRPLPVGKTEFDERTIRGFAAFARRHLIAATYVGKDRVAFVPVRESREAPFLLGLKPDYTRETWVCFDFAGNVSANISQRDYLDYREALSFDKLCHSLGDLFVEFVGMFARGEGVRIIDRLDAVGLSMFA
jgi:hypothetical protein